MSSDIDEIYKCGDCNKLIPQDLVNKYAIAGSVDEVLFIASCHGAVENFVFPVDKRQYATVGVNTITFFFVHKPPIKIDLSKYPQKCPKCKAPAYIGFSNIDCSNKCK